MAKRKLPPCDISTIYTALTSDDREYIRDKYNSLGEGLKMLVKDGPFEQAVKRAGLKIIKS